MSPRNSQILQLMEGPCIFHYHQHKPGTTDAARHSTSWTNIYKGIHSHTPEGGSCIAKVEKCCSWRRVGGLYDSESRVERVPSGCYFLAQLYIIKTLAETVTHKLFTAPKHKKGTNPNPVTAPSQERFLMW